MRFGPVRLTDAEGAILVHSLHTPDRTIKKGTFLDRTHLEDLKTAGHENIVVARLDADDVHENEAASILANALTGDDLAPGKPGTGRCSLFADRAGLLKIDRDRIDAFNCVDEAITVATLPAYGAVTAGQMVATVKIIPFAVPQALVDRCRAALGDRAPLEVAAYRSLSVALLMTRTGGEKSSLVEKTLTVTRGRLETVGAYLDVHRVCAHDEPNVSATLKEIIGRNPDLILVIGSSAIVDRRDVVPAAIEDSGGTIRHLGMPVDPGNLTLLAELSGIPILGLPGSARSPRTHGSDWLLQRIAAGIPATSDDIMKMGVGGLLKEIPGRPMPRLESAPPRPEDARADDGVHAIVLAAGQSRRMGRVNKLLENIGGQPLVRRVVTAAAGSRASGITVVTGHQADAVRQALDGLEISFVHNPDYADGLSGSLKAGIASIPESARAALVCLGDMPGTSAPLLDSLITAFDPEHGKEICVPTRDGKRGNPVLWGRRFFSQLAGLAGDVGARHLIGENAEYIAEVPVDDDSIFVDLDTPEALQAYLQQPR